MSPKRCPKCRGRGWIVPWWAQILMDVKGCINSMERCKPCCGTGLEEKHNAE